MGKTIIISQKQLNEIVGTNTSYLEMADSDFNEFNAHTEVSTGGKLSIKQDSNPVTTDAFASKKAKNPSWSNNGITRPLPLTCSKKKTKILEANQEGEHRTWYIPDEIYDTLNYNRNNFNGDKNAEGWDRLNNLINKRDVSYHEMRRLKNFFDNDATKQVDHYKLIGGDKMKNWVNQSLTNFTSSIADKNANLKSLGIKKDTKISGNGKGHSSSTTTTFNGKTSTF